MTSFSQYPLESDTGATLAIYSWKSSAKPNAIVHINHGMSEHCARYDRFAKSLNEAGYHVIAHDHRGHGKTIAADSHLGLFARQDGWTKVIGDVDSVNAHAKASFDNLPIVYFGHSMGAIIGVEYCIRHSGKLHAAALWNSGVDGGALLVMYRFLLSIERMFKGSDVPSALARKLTFETWNKVFKPNRTESDWLSQDEKEVDKYINDPLCGFDACNGLWLDLTQGIKNGNDDGQLSNIRKDLPIHLLAGGQDPCSDQGKAVERLRDRMIKLGMQDVSYTLYPDNRHEALNELNRETVTADFVDWLNKHFNK